jgi:hypothetical protein
MLNIDPLSLCILNTVFIVLVWLASVNSRYFNPDRKSIAEVSEEYPTSITPSNYTFSIWGVIYFFTGLFTIYQWTSYAQGQTTIITEVVSIWFTLSCITNVLWILAFQTKRMRVALVCIVATFLFLAVVYEHLMALGLPWDDPWTFIAVCMTFSIYTAWISVASLLNVLITFKGQAQSSVIGVAMITIAALESVFVAYYAQDPFFSAVICWALIGIWKGSDYMDEINKASVVLAIVAGLASIISLAYSIGNKWST